MNGAPHSRCSYLSLWILVSGFSILTLNAQQNGIEQDSDCITLATGEHFLHWYGHTGRSYFVQVSDSNKPLAKWYWAPFIEGGNDEEISYQVGGTLGNAFFRLLYTDQIPQPWKTLETADFDGDGLTNRQELTLGSSPFNQDTDNDGFYDGAEAAADTSPLDPAAYPLQIVAASPQNLALESYATGQSASQPVLLYFNQPLPASVVTIPSSWLIHLPDEYSADPGTGTTVILPGRRAVAFIPAGNSFLAWPEDGDEYSPPLYQISFDNATTGIPHLLAFSGYLSTTTAAGSVDSGPWVGNTVPGRDYIDTAQDSVISAQWSEALDPASLVPGNVTLEDADGNPVAFTLSFDYTYRVNQLLITPVQPLVAATTYTVTLGSGFTNLTGKAHHQPVSWSFTTRPLRPTPTGPGPYITAVSPADFAFGIVPPNDLSITFSEAMDATTLTATNIHLRAGLGFDLTGTFTYANNTLTFHPDTPFPAGTYFTLTLAAQNVTSQPATGSPLTLQGNTTFVSATANTAGGATANANGTPPPGSLAPLQLHYAWGEVFDPDYDSGCAVEITLIDKTGVQTVKTLPPDTDAIQVQESGDIPPATTVVITPNFVAGSDKDLEEERPECGIKILPTDGALPPGMTYLAFRKTPGATPELEYLGPFGGTTPYECKCADAQGNGPQSLYLVPVPVTRRIAGSTAIFASLLEGQTAKAIPGQQMNLLLEDTYLNRSGLAGVTFDTFSWTLPGKNFKGYNPNAADSNYTILSPAEFLNKFITFYWADSGEKEPKVDFHVIINSAQVGATSSIAKIHVDKPVSKFDLVVGGERVDQATNKAGNLVQMFGLFSKTVGSVIPGVRFSGSVSTPSGWTNGEWNFVQLTKSKRSYNYVGGGCHA